MKIENKYPYNLFDTYETTSFIHFTTFISDALYILALIDWLCVIHTEMNYLLAI